MNRQYNTSATTSKGLDVRTCVSERDTAAKSSSLWLRVGQDYTLAR